MSFHSKAWAGLVSECPGSNLSLPPTSFIMLGLHLLHLLCQLLLSLLGLKGSGLCLIAKAMLNVLFFQPTKKIIIKGSGKIYRDFKSIEHEQNPNKWHTRLGPTALTPVPIFRFSMPKKYFHSFINCVWIF